MVEDVMGSYNVDFGMGCKRFFDIRQTFGGLELKMVENMAVRILDDDIPTLLSWIRGEFRDGSRRQMTMVEPLDIFDLKQLSFNSTDNAS